MDAVEINVKEAALRLGLTERQVRNHIKAKNIQAIKVGKEWFVDSASVEAFRRHHRIPKLDNQPLPVTETTSAETEAKPEVNKEKLANEKEPSPFVASEAADGEDKNKNSSENINKSPGQQIFKLNCYKLCVEAFSTWTPHSSEPEILRELKFAALRNLGAGYYSFDFQTKCDFYRKSRASIGSLLAIVFSREEWKNAHQKEVAFLEQKVLPALSALIRKMEKKS